MRNAALACAPIVAAGLFGFAAAAALDHAIDIRALFMPALAACIIVLAPWRFGR